MTTTACDDKLSAEPEPVHQPYDVAAILRKNIADLEKELKRQRKQNAAATERLREQIERVTSEWERAENDVPAAPAVAVPAVPDEWREVLQMLFDACADYAVDVGEDDPLKFRVMMRRARALLQSTGDQK